MESGNSLETQRIFTELHDSKKKKGFNLTWYQRGLNSTIKDSTLVCLFSSINRLRQDKRVVEFEEGIDERC